MPALIFPKPTAGVPGAPSPSPQRPDLIVEIGRVHGWQLGVAGSSELGTTTSLADFEWVDISDKVLSASIRRGRQHELDRVEAGTASVSLLNQDGVFNPTNTTSPYYPTIRPMTPFRIRAEFPPGVEAPPVVPPPFSPADITGLVGWYDFSDVSTLFTDTGMTTLVSADGQTIKGVNDKSATNHDVTHATGCTYKTAIQNGLSIARFNGTTQTLGPATVTQAQPVTIIAAVKSDVTADGQNRVFVGSGTDVSTFGKNNTTPDPNAGWIVYNGGPCQALGAADTNFNILVGYSNNTNSKIYENGGAAIDNLADSGTNGWNNWRIGSYDGASQFWDGDICEVAIYSGALALTDLNLIGAYLGSKWGITWTTAT